MAEASFEHNSIPSHDEDPSFETEELFPSESIRRGAEPPSTQRHSGYIDAFLRDSLPLLSPVEEKLYSERYHHAMQDLRSQVLMLPSFLCTIATLADDLQRGDLIAADIFLTLKNRGSYNSLTENMKEQIHRLSEWAAERLTITHALVGEIESGSHDGRLLEACLTETSAVLQGIQWRPRLIVNTFRTAQFQLRTGTYPLPIHIQTTIFQEGTNAINRASEAEEKLTRSNLRLVVSVAKRFSSDHRGEDFADLLQHGQMGLMTAIERFDPARGFRFSTFATNWIRQAVSRAVGHSRTIRLPIHVSGTLTKISREMDAFTREHGRKPSFDELANALNMPIKKLLTLTAIMDDATSLDILTGSGKNNSLGEIIGDNLSLHEFEASEEEIFLSLVLQKASKTLSERERAILHERIIDDVDIEIVSQELGISPARIRGIERAVRGKLRVLVDSMETP